MNSLYTLAKRQQTSLQSDLKALEDNYQSGSTNTASLNGQITASLNALDRTVEDYDSMARREIVEVKRDKALSRVAVFKDDYIMLRKQHERIKAAGAGQKASMDRDALLSSSSGIASSSGYASIARPRNSVTADTTFTINMSEGLGGPERSSSISSNGYPSSNGGRWQPNSPYIPQSSMNGSGGRSEFGSSVHDNPRTNYALRENDFMSSTGVTLDAYIAQGQAVLGNLGIQKDVLKGTKRKLLSAANTLGLSRGTIQYIERRTKGDYYILIVGGTLTLLSFYLILKYFG